MELISAKYRVASLMLMAAMSPHRQTPVQTFPVLMTKQSDGPLHDWSNVVGSMWTHEGKPEALDPPPPDDPVVAPLDDPLDGPPDDPPDPPEDPPDDPPDPPEDPPDETVPEFSPAVLPPHAANSAPTSAKAKSEWWLGEAMGRDEIRKSMGMAAVPQVRASAEIFRGDYGLPRLGYAPHCIAQFAYGPGRFLVLKDRESSLGRPIAT
jgi:hypothetical protein